MEKRTPPGADPCLLGVKSESRQVAGSSPITYTVQLDDIRFLWDAKKNRLNVRKHGVSFEEAQTAFYDEKAKLYSDPDHSEGDARFILLGMSFRLRTLVVCHCYREEESTIRIISARKADTDEQRDYWSEP